MQRTDTGNKVPSQYYIGLRGDTLTAALENAPAHPRHNKVNAFTTAKRFTLSPHPIKQYVPRSNSNFSVSKTGEIEKGLRENLHEHLRTYCRQVLKANTVDLMQYFEVHGIHGLQSILHRPTLSFATGFVHAVVRTS